MTAGGAHLTAGAADPSALFDFDSIVVVGASEEVTRVGGAPIDLLKRFGFQGRIIGVNPKYTSVQGVPCVTDVDDVDGPVDMAAICVSANAARESLSKLATKGLKAAVVFSGGFAEAGPEGAALQEWLAEFSRTHGIAILGPNCAGHIAFTTGRIVTFASQPAVLTQARPGRIALLSQSGGVAFHLWAEAIGEGATFSHLIATGNEAGLTFADLLGHFAKDKSVGSVVGYIEGLSDGAAFCAAAQAMQQAGKPLMLLKSGVSTIGRDAAASHTAQLSTEDAGYDAAFDRYGVVRVSTLGELTDHARVLSINGIGDRITLATNSGGAGVYMADLCARHGIPLAKLSDTTVERLSRVIPTFGRARNPVDVTAQVVNDMSILESSLSVLLDDPQTGVLLFALTGKGQPNAAREVVAAFSRLRQRSTVPIILAWLGSPEAARRLAAENGLPVYQDPDRFLAPLGAHLRARARPALANATPTAQPLLLDREEISRKITRSRDGTALLSEPVCLDLLESAGLDVPRRWLAQSREEVEAIGEQPSFPLVMKLARPEVAHKSDLGGVVTNIRSRDDLAAAWRAMPSGTEAVMVAEQIEDGLEILVGCVRDPVFGMRITLAPGGLFVESAQEALTLIPPFDEAYVRSVLPRLPLWPALSGARSQRPRAVDALVKTICDVGAFAAALPPEITEFECNPVLVTRDRAVAVDAIGIVESKKEHANAD